MATLDLAPEAAGTEAPEARPAAAVRHSREAQLEAGRALRKRAPRASHAQWDMKAAHRDPIAILEASNQDRLQQLVPLRYGRMLRSPFTFLRGSAALMAHDLATGPISGLRVQACGDCHLLNFGLFATPERNLVFDLNDFDETLPAPWEWDVKRLAVSLAVAARDNGITDPVAREAVVASVQAYRERLRECSKLSPLEVWYMRMDASKLIEEAPNEKVRTVRRQLADKARKRVVENLFPKIAGDSSGKHRIIDQPPVLFHVQEADAEAWLLEGLADYRQSLSDERRVLLDRYRLEDFAMKVVGIGSVGTRCMIGLFFADEGHPLILQFKEARRSVLEPFAGRSDYDNQGHRVVMGQRLMQSSSDIFLGWARGRQGRDFYVRQLRDMKLSVPTEGFTGQQVLLYGRLCGWTLARAHAKSGNATIISGYLGKSDTFDEAMGDFALAYADQTELDHAALVAAERRGRIEALLEV